MERFVFKRSSSLSEYTTLLSVDGFDLTSSVKIDSSTRLLEPLRFGFVLMPKGKKLTDHIHLHDQVKLLRILAGMGEGHERNLVVRFNIAPPDAKPLYENVALNMQSGNGLIRVDLRIMSQSNEQPDRQTKSVTTLNRELCDLTQLAGASLALVRTKANAKSIHLTKRLDGAMQCCVDPNAIRQIMFGLLSAAVDRTADKGCVGLEVHAKPEAMGAIIIVTDTGTAPKTEQLELTLARTCAQMHGGELQVISQSGIGTRVEVTLPDVAADETRQQPVNETVVEDEREMRRRRIDAAFPMLKKAG